MNRKLPENTSAFAFGLGLAAALLAGVMAHHTGLLVFRGLLPILFMLMATAIIAFIRLRLGRRAGEEERDRAMLARERPEAALFTPEEGRAEEAFTIARTRRHVEAYAVPWLAPLLGGVQLYWAWRLFRNAPDITAGPVAATALAASLFGGMAFALFLASRFLLGLSRGEEGRLLRGPGVYAGLAAWGALIGLAGTLAQHFGLSQADAWASRIMLAATAVLGLENLLNSLLALYSHRPEKCITTYESRLGALAVDPGVLTRSMTEAMDYQFGFSFSQTWFFRILQQAILPLLVLQAALLYGMSCLVFLGPHETGILERFGRPVAAEAHLGSGFHVKKPWPLETVRRVPTGRMHRIEAGYAARGENHLPPVITWTVPHFEQEDIFLVAARPFLPGAAGGRDPSGVPVSMVTVNIPVEYRITNAFSYAYRYASPEQMLRQMVYQTATRQLARRDIGELFGAERMAVARAMHDELQAAADRLQLGVRIEFFGLSSVHPPVPVADAFQSVVGALEDKEAAISEARGYAGQVLPLALAYVDAGQAEAEAYRFRRATLAGAESRQFVERRMAAQASPRVYRAFQYLDMLAGAAAGSRLYVLDLPSADPQTLWLNLEEKEFSGALDMAPLMMEENH